MESNRVNKHQNLSGLSLLLAEADAAQKSKEWNEEAEKLGFKHVESISTELDKLALISSQDSVDSSEESVVSISEADINEAIICAEVARYSEGINKHSPIIVAYETFVRSRSSQSGMWSPVSPIRALVDNLAVNNMANSIDSVAKSETLEEEPDPDPSLLSPASSW